MGRVGEQEKAEEQGLGDILRGADQTVGKGPPVEAQQHLALNQYLAQLENPQVAFGIKQKAPEMVDKGVQLTMELKSYLPARVHSPGHRTAQIDDGEEDVTVMAAVSYAVS